MRRIEDLEQFADGPIPKFDGDLPVRFIRTKKTNQPNVCIIIATCKKGGFHFAHSIAYDDVWPQELFAQWGKWAPAIWRECVKLMKANLAFELCKGEHRMNSPSDAIDITRNVVNDRKREGYTRAAIQTILARTDDERDVQTLNNIESITARKRR